jgi:electron-transferring-flavoprotein dehydrogenase
LGFGVTPTREEFVVQENDVIETDVVIVGGGPAGLAAAIELANRFKKAGETKRILLIEKGKEIGSHILSGAVIRPEVFRELLGEEAFGDLPLDAPVGYDSVMWLSATGAVKLPFHPPYMANDGNRIASLGEVCRYLATVAEGLGVEIYTGFAVTQPIYEEGKIVGIETGETGVDRHGVRQKNYQPPTTVKAAITILAEGSRGSVTRQVIDRLGLEGRHPQIYSLGVKELWSLPRGRIAPGSVHHTFGYPLKSGEEFGGGFIYGLSGDRVALGLVVGLDFSDPTFDIHAAMQIWKNHPEVSRWIEGGTILEAGAKTLPEGGWYSLPRYYDDNLLIVGDGAGFLSSARLKGVHLAVKSGILAAHTAVGALQQGDTSREALSRYEKQVNASCIYDELYPTRNMRSVMGQGVVRGGLKTALQLITWGACLSAPPVEADREMTQTPSAYTGVPFAGRFDLERIQESALSFDKVTTVFQSNTLHDEIQPIHLHINDPEQFQRSNVEAYGLAEAAFCPGDVYESHTGQDGSRSFRLHPENCLHCKTCDIKSPGGGITWRPPYGGDGPDYHAM